MTSRFDACRITRWGLLTTHLVDDIACQVPSGDLAEHASTEVESSLRLPLKSVDVT